MLQHLYPQYPQQLSIPQRWNRFHAYNLVGFLNSVPQHRLIDAVLSLVQRWQQQQTAPTITIDVQATGNPYHRAHIGRHLQASHSTRTPSGPATIQANWDWICNVAITLIEHSWQQLHTNLLHHTDLHFNYYRYVDNRFITRNEHPPSDPDPDTYPR